MTIGLSIGLMLVAFLVSTLVYPYILTFAREHKIVDNPNARKLQRVPVPVMGGTTVFIGIFTAIVLGCFILGNAQLAAALPFLIIMFLVGVWDDVKDVSPFLRFLIEILVVWSIMVGLKVEINDFHGLWGFHSIPDVLSVPLSLIAGVGIINAINLIDGVDGYCTTYVSMACLIFAIIFYFAGDMIMFTLALIVIGALIPFFFHNVFGTKSKMFMGDGGSLMLGVILTLFTFSTLSSNSPCAIYGDTGLSLVALTLAILAVPVFDTLKVMIYRVVRGYSPFRPDKTHLHHLFIELNYSHLATSGLIVAVNGGIVAALIVCWQLGMPVDWQVYTVILMSLMFTWVFYFFMEGQHRKNDGEGSAMYQSIVKRAKKTNISDTPLWNAIRNAVDGKLLGGTIREMVTSSSTDSDKPNRIDPRIR